MDLFYYIVLSVHCSLVVTCMERANLFVLSYVMFSCGFVFVLCGVLVQVWYLIILNPDLCCLPYFNLSEERSLKSKTLRTL